MPCETNDDCDLGECYGYTACTRKETFYCGVSFEDATTTCGQPCPSGDDNDCEKGEECFKHTSCADANVDFNSSEPTPSPILALGITVDDDDTEGGAPLLSYFCGTDFEDASTTCSIPCPTKSDSQCPLGQQCFAHTTCAGTEPDTYYCGKDLEDATSCNLKCESGSSRDCPKNHSCYGYVSCSDVDVEFTTDDEGTELNVTFATDDDTEGGAPLLSYFCGTDFEDASTTCSIPCPTKSDSQCPLGQQCFAHTTCAGTEPDTYYCGKDLEDATSCNLKCESGSSRDCPKNHSCYGYVSCSDVDVEFTTDDEGTELNVTFATDDADTDMNLNFGTDDTNVDVNFETDDAGDDVNVDVNFETDDANVDVNFETDDANVDVSFDNDNTDISVDVESDKTDVAVSVETNESEESMSIEFEAIPTESYFCGTDYDDASESCAIPCPMKTDDDCPGNLKCFPFTPCANPGSFFCGQTFDKASQSCTLPCPSGKSNTCPNGENCFAYTTCKPITETPTEIPTQKPTFPPVTPLPTKEPTSKPSNSPSKRPTKQPTDLPVSFCENRCVHYNFMFK